MSLQLSYPLVSHRNCSLLQGALQTLSFSSFSQGITILTQILPSGTASLGSSDPSWTPTPHCFLCSCVQLLGLLGKKYLDNTHEFWNLNRAMSSALLDHTLTSLLIYHAPCWTLYPHNQNLEKRGTNNCK